MKHQIGRERPFGRYPRCLRRSDRRHDDVDLFLAEEAAFAGMRIETRYGDLRARDAHLPKRAIDRGERTADTILGDERYRARQADMQRDMRDALVVEADHQKRIVDGRAGTARDE